MTAKLTTADLDLGLLDDRFLGFGYLGERNHFFATYGMSVVPHIAAADQFVLDAANARGWDAEKLFEWANSKIGRWAGEALLADHQPSFNGALSAEAQKRAARHL